MKTPQSNLEIYSDKKSIVKSIAGYVLAVFCLAMVWIVIFTRPVAEGREWALYFLGLIFAFYFIGLSAVICSCVIDFFKHPRRLYSFSQNGYTSHRSNKSYYWNQFKPFYFSGLEKNIVTPSKKKLRYFTIERRCIRPADFEKALEFLKLNSPPELIKKLQ